MSHNTACAPGMDSLLIRSPRWAEDSSDHPIQVDTSLPRHSRSEASQTPNHTWTRQPGPSRDSRSQTSHPKTHSRTCRVFRVAGVGTSTSGDLDTYPGRLRQPAPHPRLRRDSLRR
jgi:hypothetical protein